MYVRFEAEYESSEETVKGIFPAMGCLLKDTKCKNTDKDKLNNLNEWFKYNLELPKVQDSSSNYATPTTGISWFKDTAEEHIDKLREISKILRKYGVAINYIENDNPGTIVYEDDYQVLVLEQ